MVKLVEGNRVSMGTPDMDIAVGVYLEDQEDEVKEIHRVMSGIESQTLQRIHELMNTAENKLNEEKEEQQRPSNLQNPSMQRKFDFEFEKLLMQLRNEYQTMFDNKA